MQKRPFFVSTAIPYVNATPHIGHAVEFVQSDIIARYHRLRGETVFFLSGTDDNALKNVLKAEEAGEDVATFVERHAANFKHLLSLLSVSNDDFIQTASDPRHASGVQKLWRCFKPEDIVKKTYTGMYCVGCEEFKTEKDLVDGHCPEHPNAPLETIAEENYFFRLGNYAHTLEELIASDTLRITPETRKNEVLSFIRGGLEDLSISRSVARARGWGVRVPGDETQVMYVWVDALSNYITALGYADESETYKTFWEEGSVRTHVIGKGISRFHAIYWPAFLLSAGVPLPTDIFVHGYLTVQGQKMSKSLGNVVDPVSIVRAHGTDAFRYFVARHVHPFEDGDYSDAYFRECYNANLANGLGNLAARILTLSQTHLAGPVVMSGEKEIPQEYAVALDSFEINRAADYVWQRIAKLDARITQEKPFAVVKEDPERGKALITELVLELASITHLLQPFLPQTAEKLTQAIAANAKPQVLFPRIDA